MLSLEGMNFGSCLPGFLLSAALASAVAPARAGVDACAKAVQTLHKLEEHRKGRRLWNPRNAVHELRQYRKNMELIIDASLRGPAATATELANMRAELRRRMAQRRRYRDLRRDEGNPYYVSAQQLEWEWQALILDNYDLDLSESLAQFIEWRSPRDLVNLFREEPEALRILMLEARLKDPAIFNRETRRYFFRETMSVLAQVPLLATIAVSPVVVLTLLCQSSLGDPDPGDPHGGLYGLCRDLRMRKDELYR